MTSAADVSPVVTSGRSGQLRLETIRQLRQMNAHASSAALLTTRADRATNPLVARTLLELAARHRQAAERSREALASLGLLLPGHSSREERGAPRVGL